MTTSAAPHSGRPKSNPTDPPAEPTREEPDPGARPEALAAVAGGPSAAQPGAVQPNPVQVLQTLGSIVAPTTALTALMYFFGLLHSYWFLQTFGVDYSVMGFTTQDYLLRSADGLFVPLTVVAGTSLVVVWASGPLVGWLSPERRPKVLREVRHTAVAVGILFVAVAVVGVVRPRALQAVPAVPGLTLSGGVLLLTAAARMYRARPGSIGAAPRGPAAVWEWGAVFLLVTVGLFWAAADYSAAVGARRGGEVVAALPAWPDVVLYGERDLNLSAPGVLKTVCGDPGSAYRFRYDGLKLILQSGDQYLFLPEGWTRKDGTALVVPRTDALRLDFAAAGAARDAGC